MSNFSTGADEALQPNQRRKKPRKLLPHSWAIFLDARIFLFFWQKESVFLPMSIHSALSSSGLPNSRGSILLTNMTFHVVPSCPDSCGVHSAELEVALDAAPLENRNECLVRLLF
ncbi:hypothetical protein QBC45DRAFT_323489 [Copromyces sp. CBS 386.78]|nr:hypothetical protein QBC45DRAFT_323489 [Copromyces sp. CBS 386.78]